MKTYSAKTESVQKNWYLVDAANKKLGRLASEVAKRLRGKHKPEYTPHADTGDFIVVVNAEKISVSGNKFRDKIYHRHSGYTGGIKSASFEKMIEKSPENVIELAVKRMLPRSPLGRMMMKKLKIYAGATHKHAAQNPQLLEIKEAE